MPIPVARLWNSPWMTLTLCLIGSSTDSVLLSFMSAPSPVDSQWSSLTPFPMNRTPNRFGGSTGLVVSAKDRDSSQGSPMATPAPRRIVRRDKRLRDGSIILFTFLVTFRLRGWDSFVEKLRAGDDGFHQRSHAV